MVSDKYLLGPPNSPVLTVIREAGGGGGAVVRIVAISLSLTRVSDITGRLAFASLSNETRSELRLLGEVTDTCSLVDKFKLSDDCLSKCSLEATALGGASGCTSFCGIGGCGKRHFGGSIFGCFLSRIVPALVARYCGKCCMMYEVAIFWR